MKPCPKCGEPKSLINCEKCREEANALEVNSLLDWRIYKEDKRSCSECGDLLVQNERTICENCCRDPRD